MPRCVATYAPMKRGLKVRSYQRLRHGRIRTCVATYAPMKRGLKDDPCGFAFACSAAKPVATYAPMKRGLKDEHQAAALVRHPTTRSNLCPDEKGTERYTARWRVSRALSSVATYAPMKRGLKDWAPHATRRNPGSHNVATYAPMKRGLKVIGISPFNLRSTTATR